MVPCGPVPLGPVGRNESARRTSDVACAAYAHQRIIDMSFSRLSIAVAGVGVVFGLVSIAALAAGASQPALVFGALAALHTLVAVAGSRSTLVAVIGGPLGLLEIALIAFWLLFVIGLSLGEGGLDLADLWFAPLNGYGALAVAGAIVAVALGMVVAAVRAIRGARATARSGG